MIIVCEELVHDSALERFSGAWAALQRDMGVVLCSFWSFKVSDCVSLASQHPLCRHETFFPHRSSGMHPPSADPHLCTKSKAIAI